MFPAQSVAMHMQTLTALREHYGLEDQVWQAFMDYAGDPGEARLLAVLPLPY